MRKIALYPLSERIWHWIQALTILGLLMTGAEVHAPDQIHLLGFTRAVQAHNAFALLFVANALLGVFYFITSGLIRQYVPEPREFMGLAAKQTLYYLRGIFRGDPHPMQHDADNKLNPLQQVTYLVILNVLLPVQLVTGLLIWGAHRWPTLLSAVGGLPVLVPIHVLAAWFLLAFTIMHIYLTTTGETPWSNTRAMILGYLKTAHPPHPQAPEDKAEPRKAE